MMVEPQRAGHYRVTKAELRKVYRQWRDEKCDAIYVIEAVAFYLGEK